MVPITGGEGGELPAHPLSIPSSSTAAAVEHGQFPFVGIDVFLLNLGMGGLHREHALQVFECSDSAPGVFGLTVELFVGEGFLRLGQISLRLEACVRSMPATASASASSSGQNHDGTKSKIFIGSAPCTHAP